MRRARQDDVKEIVKISRKIFPEVDWINPKKLSRCLGEGEFSFVVEEKGKIIGAVIAEEHEEEPHMVYIHYMGCARMGKGLGTKLLKRVEQEARKRKKKGILTDTENPRFYLKSGFEVCGFLYYNQEGETFLIKKF